jgi:hypothetical protein
LGTVPPPQGWVNAKREPTLTSTVPPGWARIALGFIFSTAEPSGTSGNHANGLLWPPALVLPPMPR